MSIIGNISQQNNTISVSGSGAQTQAAAQQTAHQPLELKTGSTIQGTVISITDSEGGKTANISVGDNVISARLQDGMGLREGQTLNFNVRSSGAGGVSITPLYENTSVDQSTLKALTAAGIEITGDSVQMVKTMMEASLPINKEALTEMNKNLSAYPNASISTMVEMKSLNIPINDNNLVQFQSYKNYEHQVTSAMESIMEDLPNAYMEMVSSGNETGALNLFGSVLKLFGEEGQGQMQGAEAAAGEAAQAAAQELAEEAAPQQVAANPESKDMAAVSKELQAQILVDPQAASGENVIAGGAADETAKTGLKEAATLEQQGQKMDMLSDKFTDNLRNLGIPEETINKYNEALKEASVKGAQLSDDPSAVNRMESAQKALLKELATAFESSDLSNPADKAVWKNIFSNNDYTKLLKDNMSSQWLLKPLDVEKKENIDNLYQRLGNQVKGLTNAINQNLGPESGLGQTASNLQNNLDFMNQLNQMFQYVQLPLQMAGQNVHGDLYVYRNKHKKISEDGSVSAALHLDMENLGPVDVYVKMKDTKVSTNFYVADESVIDLINDNIHILNERLNKRGYTMNVTMKLHDDMDGQDAAVDEMLNVMKTPVLSTASFDARA